jgi:ubiquinone biosynthesis monooxygenase Coq7
LRILLANNADKHTELLELIKQFRDDEIHHHDLGKLSQSLFLDLFCFISLLYFYQTVGIQHEAEKAILYKQLSEVIKAGCKAAVWVAERI